MNYIEQIAAFVPCNAQERSDKALIQQWIMQYPHNILLRDNQMAHITSSGLIMNPSLTHMLMVHHNIYNTWTWTGGHADGQSDLLQIAIKEAKEETGLAVVTPYCPDILSLDILPVYGHMKNGHYVSAHLHLSAAFLLIADTDKPLAVCLGENSAVRWVPWDKVPGYSNEPFMITIYQKMLQRIGHEKN
jgi:8-oxo-dGTP pyrophosphatase MutT (NUDIX family)